MLPPSATIISVSGSDDRKALRVKPIFAASLSVGIITEMLLFTAINFVSRLSGQALRIETEFRLLHYVATAPPHDEPDPAVQPKQ